MKIRIVTFLIFWMSIPTLSSAAPVSENNGLACPYSSGYLQGPFVPTADAARQIFAAIRNAIAPEYSAAKRTSIIVDDKGDHWEVYQRIHVVDRAGKTVDLMGGGGLGLEIDKCTASISHVGFNR